MGGKEKRRRRDKVSDFQPNSDFIAAAIADFAKRGGKVVKIETDWDEVGRYGYRSEIVAEQQEGESRE